MLDINRDVKKKTYSTLLLCNLLDNCRQLEFLPPMKDKALRGHVIHTSDVSDLEMCQFKCYLASSCISLNLGPIRANKKRSCELCDAHGDGNKHSDALTFRKGYLHQGTNVNTYTDVVVILLFLCEGGRSFFPCNFPFCISECMCACTVLLKFHMPDWIYWKGIPLSLSCGLHGRMV